jgi:hypothetical protein
MVGLAVALQIAVTEGADAHRVAGGLPATVRPGLEVPAGGAAHFFWELYGVSGDTLEAGRVIVQVEVRTVTGGRVPLRDLRGDGPLGCGLSVGLPADLHGVHVARLTVTDRRTGAQATVERAFFVRPG